MILFLDGKVRIFIPDYILYWRDKSILAINIVKGVLQCLIKKYFKSQIVGYYAINITY